MFPHTARTEAVVKLVKQEETAEVKINLTCVQLKMMSWEKISFNRVGKWQWIRNEAQRFPNCLSDNEASITTLGDIMEIKIDEEKSYPEYSERANS